MHHISAVLIVELVELLRVTNISAWWHGHFVTFWFGQLADYFNIALSLHFDISIYFENNYLSAVHLVANIGNQQSELKWPLGGAYAIGFLFSLVAEDPVTNVTRSTVVAIIATNWKGRKWRRTKYKKGSKSLFLGLTLTAVLYGALWLSALLHNAYVTTSDGQTVPLKDAIGNIMESDAWKHPIDTFLSMWEEFESTGFDGSWQEFIDAIDPEGERNALQVTIVTMTTMTTLWCIPKRFGWNISWFCFW